MLSAVPRWLSDPQGSAFQPWFGSRPCSMPLRRIMPPLARIRVQEVRMMKKSARWPRVAARQQMLWSEAPDPTEGLGTEKLRELRAAIAELLMEVARNDAGEGEDER